MADASQYSDDEVRAALSRGQVQTRRPGFDPSRYSDDEVQTALKAGPPVAQDLTSPPAGNRSRTESVVRKYALNTIRSLVGAFGGPDLTDDQAETVARVAANIYTSPAKLPLNLANLAERGGRWAAGGDFSGDTVIPSGQDVLNRGLEAVGIDPRPSGKLERAATAGGEAVFTSGSAGLTGRLPSLAENPIGQATGAAAGSATHEAMTEAGYGPVAATLGSIAAGGISGIGGKAAVSAIDDAATLGRRAVSSGAGLVTHRGRERAAGRVLNRAALAPDEAAERAGRLANQSDIEIIPGSRPTLAEVSQDPGIARLQRTLASSRMALETGTADLNNLRVAVMDKQIRASVDAAFRTTGGAIDPQLMAEMTRQQQAITGQFFRKVDPITKAVDPSRAKAMLDDLATKYAGKESVTNFVAKLRSQLDDKRAGTFNFIWNARKGLDDLIYETKINSSSGTAREIARLGEIIRRQYNKVLTDAAPEFEPYLKGWSSLQREKDRMAIASEIMDKAGVNNRNIITDVNSLYGEQGISEAAFRRAHDKLLSRRNELGKLTQEQKDALNRIREEKARANILISGGAPGNSQTAQNIAMDRLIQDDLLYSILGQGAANSRGLASLVNSPVGRALPWLTGTAEREIMGNVYRGLADPAHGAYLMGIGKLPYQIDFKEAIRQPGGGLIGAGAYSGALNQGR